MARTQAKNEPVIAELFVRFGSGWGSAWTSRFGSSELYQAALIEWAIDLEPYEQACIDAAIDVCKTEFTQWPPTLGQFRKICFDLNRRRMAKQKMLLQSRLPAPAKKTPDEIADYRSQLKNMVNILRRGRAGCSA